MVQVDRSVVLPESASPLTTSMLFRFQLAGRISEIE